MSLLGSEREAKVSRPIENRLYSSGWQGGITDSELQDIKEGDFDRSTGLKRCAFCRQPKVLPYGDTCDLYCYTNQNGSVPVGKVYAWDKERIGREWMDLG